MKHLTSTAVVISLVSAVRLGSVWADGEGGNGSSKIREHAAGLFVNPGKTGKNQGVSQKEVSAAEMAKLKADRLLRADADVKIIGIEDKYFPLASGSIHSLDEMSPSDFSISFSTTSGDTLDTPTIYKLEADGSEITVVASSKGRIFSVVEHTSEAEIVLTEKIRDSTFVVYKSSQSDKAALSKFKYGDSERPPVQIDDANGGRLLSETKTDPQVRRRHLQTDDKKYIQVDVWVDVAYDVYVRYGSETTTALTTMMAEVASDFLYAGIQITANFEIDTTGDSAFSGIVQSNRDTCGGKGGGVLGQIRSLGLESGGDTYGLRHGIYNKDMKGGTIGCAYVGVVCNPGYGFGVSQLYSSDLWKNAMVVSHELGHNFNAEHDSSTTNNIMYPSAGIETDIWTQARAATIHAHARSKEESCAAVKYSGVSCYVNEDCADNGADSFQPVCADGNCKPGDGDGDGGGGGGDGGGGGGGECQFQCVGVSASCDLACCRAYGETSYSTKQGGPNCWCGTCPP